MATKIITAFYRANGIPIAGLTPTIDVWEMDILNPTTNTLIINDAPVLEVGGGWYRYDMTSYNPNSNYTFTFDGGVSLSNAERYQTAANESYAEDVWASDEINNASIGSMGFALSNIGGDTDTLSVNLSTLTIMVDNLLAYQENRTKIDKIANTLTIYDDDGITPLQIFDLLDDNGIGSTDDVCERVPQ